MTVYVCDDCGHMSEHDSLTERAADPHEYWGHVKVDGVLVCPSCGSDNIRECEQCEECGSVEYECVIGMSKMRCKTCLENRIKKDHAVLIRWLTNKHYDDCLEAFAHYLDRFEEEEDD